MKEITQKWLIFVFLMCFILFVANIRNVKADVYLLGDSWLADTYNPQANYHIGFHTGEQVHNYAVNSMPSKTLANEIETYGVQPGDVAIIDIGLPDFFNRISQMEVRMNMYRVIDYLSSNNVKIVISCPAEAANLLDLNAKIADKTLPPAWRLCQKLHDRNPYFVNIVDLQSKLMAIQAFNHAENAVHLNELGYHVFNIGLALEVNRMKGTCNLIQQAKELFKQYPSMTPEQQCVAGQLMEGYWVSFIR
jgi:hypothetical protein